MSLQIQQQQFNSLSSKGLNPIANTNDNLSSTDRTSTSNNLSQQKQQALLFTPNSQNAQKSMTPQPAHIQIGLISPNIYGNNGLQQANNQNASTQNMRFQKNLNFNNNNNSSINSQQTQLIIHHQNNSSNNSESLCSDLRSFFQDNISGINSQFTGTLSVNKNNNNNYSSITQGSKNGSMNSNQHRVQVMTPSTNDDKSILSQNNNFISTNPKQVDLSSSSQSHNNQHLLHSQVHSKNVSQTTQMSVFNNSGEISQFNYSSLGNNQNFQSQNQISPINSVISNINFENDTLLSTKQNTSISNIDNTLQEGKCRLHPYKKVKYQMSENENDKFCSVCALEYVQQGLDVEPIIKTQQKEINLYLNEMLNVKKINDILLNSLDQKSMFIKEHSRKQIQIAQDLFLQIEKMIYEQKTQLLSQINNNMWEQINLIELKKNDTRLFEQNLLQKQQDIEKTYQQVATQMGVSEVREILIYYNSELDKIRAGINDMFKNTSFDLINLNSNHITQSIQILKKFLQEDLFKPSLTQSTLSQSISSIQNYQSVSPSKNDKKQLSRLMSNQDKKGSGKKQQYLQQQQQQQQQQVIQNKSLAQQLQIYQLEQSQQQPQAQKVIELSCAQNKQNTLQQNQQKQNYTQSEQINFNQQKEKQLFVAQIQQKQLQQQQQQLQQQQQYNEIIDTSISEKQHTQESDDLSSVQGMYVNIQNQSKISNKSNISSHKIINYSDIHDEPNLNILKDSSSPSTSSKQVIRDTKATPITQEKKPFFPFQCISPQQTTKGEGSYRQQYSISKDNQLNSRQKQFIQTEPTHLPSNKNKQGVSKQGNYQRNLLMNDEIATSNNRFKFNQNNNINNNFSLLTHFNKSQTNSNCQNLVVIPQNNSINKQQENTQNSTSQSKLTAMNNIRQLQINLVDQDSNQKSLTSRPINMNQTNQNQQFVNSQNQQQTNFMAQLIQQKQQNTLKSQSNYQQLPNNNDYNNLSSLKN